MSHLGLFHHFTMTTAPSIASAYLQLWRVTIPQIALSHEFLMQSILAVSALHIAHLDPSSRNDYWRRATAHADRAWQLAQAEMENPSPENADALFSFSMLSVYYAFAAPSQSQPQEGQRPLQGALQCINLLRNNGSIIPSVRHWVEKGLLAPLLETSAGNIQSSPQFPDHSVNAHFSDLLVFCSTTSSSGPTGLEDMENFAAAASSLRSSFLKVESMAGGESNTPLSWQWAVRLPPAFVDRLADLDAVPLVLLTHWCVLLVQIRPYWWIQGWVKQQISEIMQVMPDQYRHWLNWPLGSIKHLEENGQAGNGRVVDGPLDPSIDTA